MSEQQTVEVRFTGVRLGSHTEGADVYTLYRTPEGLYRIHIDEGEGGLAWLEAGRSGNGLTGAQVRTLFPELSAAVIRTGRISSEGRHFPSTGDVGA